MQVTDDFDITQAVFTVTRDNASPNDTMLEELEIISKEKRLQKDPNLQQPWSFTCKEGNVRCVAYIINLAVQAALATLKAVPAKQPESYWIENGAARLPIVSFEIFCINLYTNQIRDTPLLMLPLYSLSYNVISTSFGTVVALSTSLQHKFKQQD